MVVVITRKVPMIRDALLRGSCWIPGAYTPRKGFKYLILNHFCQGCYLGYDHGRKPVKTKGYANIDPLRPWNPI
jgi:hypothetical protein